MNSLIPVKTAKAQLALSRKIYGLPQRLRTLLILINGKTDVASLKRDTSFIASLKKDNSLLSNIESMLSELEQSGFIEFAKDRNEAIRMLNEFQQRYNELIEQDKNLGEPVLKNFASSGEHGKGKADHNSPLNRPDIVKETHGIGTPTVASSSPTSSSGGVNDLEYAKAQLKVFLQELMGQDYSLVAQKISNCNSLERFRIMLHSFEDIIQNYSSKKEVEKFKLRFKDFY